jgi:hypothetical protein
MMIHDVAQLVPEIAERLLDLPTLPALAPEQARFRAFDHVAAYLRRAATAQPLVVILDDLHWADAPSLLLGAHSGAARWRMTPAEIRCQECDPQRCAAARRHHAAADTSRHGR